MSWLFQSRLYHRPLNRPLGVNEEGSQMMSSVDRSVSTRHASLIPPATERTTRHLTTSPPSTPSSYRVSWACPRAPTMGRATARDSPSHATLVARWTGRRKGSTAQTRRTLARGLRTAWRTSSAVAAVTLTVPLLIVQRTAVMYLKGVLVLRSRPRRKTRPFRPMATVQ